MPGRIPRPRPSGSWNPKPKIKRPATNQDGRIKKENDLDQDLLTGFDAARVKRLHKVADTDSGSRATHHTLGPNQTQAAPGDHEHRLQGIWLYKDADGLHNSPGNYQDLGFSDAVFWDKELYAKNGNQVEIKVLKPHFARIVYRVSFDFNAGGGRRGIRSLRNGNVVQTFEIGSIAVAGVPTRVHDTVDAIYLNTDDIIKVQTIQVSGANININFDRHITHLKIIKDGPAKIDSQALTAGGIVPQTPGPQIASRQMFFETAW